MPRPGIYDIETYAGDTLSFFMVIADVINGIETPRNITGFTFKGEVKAEQGSGQPVLKTLDVTIANATQGRVSVRLDAVHMADLGSPEGEVWQYYYDVQFTMPNGDIRTPLRGTLTVDPEVTT